MQSVQPVVKFVVVHEHAYDAAVFEMNRRKKGNLTFKMEHFY